MNMTSQQKTLSTGIYTLVLLAILIWGSLKPTIVTIIETRKKLHDRQETLEKLQEKSLKINELAGELRTLSPDLQEINSYYPHNEDFSLLIDNLDKILHDHGFELRGITFQYKTNRNSLATQNLRLRYLQPITFNMQIYGDPKGLLNFFSYFESTPFNPQILNFSVNNPNSHKPQNISITFIVYKLKYPLYYED